MQIRTDAPISDPRGMAVFVKNCIEGLANGFAPQMRRWALPPLYRSGIRFAYEPEHGSGREEFASPLTTYKRRLGDCDDLVIYRLAELKAANIPASCRVFWYNSGMHVQVRRKEKLKSWVEDPSIKLGSPVSCPN